MGMADNNLLGQWINQSVGYLPQHLYGQASLGAFPPSYPYAVNYTQILQPTQVAIKSNKFHRINQLVELEEGAEYQEPLDELRLKTAKWLRR